MKSHKQHNTAPAASDHKNKEFRILSAVLGNHSNLENKLLDWKKNMDFCGRRNMTTDYVLKSRPVSTRRGTPTGWLSARLERGDRVKAFQSQIYLQAPDGQILPKRGLSGSKIRKSSAGSVSGGPTSRNIFVSEVKQVQSVPASPRPLGLRLNPRLSNMSKRAFLVENVGELSESYSWNTSEQGLRLQREVSQLSFSRAQKKVSGQTKRTFDESGITYNSMAVAMVMESSRDVGSTRMDPMYCLYGSGLSLLNRHSVDSGEIERPNYTTSAKKGVALEVKRTILKCDSRASISRLQTIKPRSGGKDALAVTVTNGTGFGSGYSDLHTEVKYSEKHHETEANDLYPEIESDDEHQETESEDAHQEAEPSEKHQETEPSEIHQETEPEETHQETEPNDIHQETEPSEIHQETESEEIHKETEPSEIQEEIEPSDTHQETESNEINKETDPS